MDTTHIIGSHAGIKIRSVQKMKADRPKDYELALIGSIAATLGFTSQRLKEFYEKGITFNSINDAINVSNSFNNTLIASGFKEHESKQHDRAMSFVRVLKKDMGGHLVNGSPIQAEYTLNKDRVDDYLDKYMVYVTIFVRDKYSKEIIFRKDFILQNSTRIENITKETYGEIRKIENLDLQRVDKDNTKIKVYRKWNLKNNKNDIVFIQTGVMKENKLYAVGLKIDDDERTETYSIDGHEFTYSQNIFDYKYCRDMAALISDEKIRNKIIFSIDKMEALVEENREDIKDNFCDFTLDQDGINVDINVEKMKIVHNILDYFFEGLSKIYPEDEKICGDIIREEINLSGFPMVTSVVTNYAKEHTNENGMGEDTITITL